MEEERTEEFSKVREIAEAICDGEVSDEQKEELHKIIFENPDAQRFYIEYMDMHARLKADASSDTFELTLRRIEEITLRSGGAVNYSSSTSTHGAPVTENHTHLIEGPQQNQKSFLLPLVALIAVTMTAIALWQFSSKEDNGVIGTLEQGELLDIISKTRIEKGSKLATGTFENNQELSVIDCGTSKLALSKSTTIELINKELIDLKKGSINVSDIKSALKININGTLVEGLNEANFDLNYTQAGQSLTVKSGKVIIQPKQWKPIHFWNFDRSTDRVSDIFGGAHGILGKGVKIVDGLAGSQALKFNNTSDAHVHLGSGGGTALGTGSFSVTDGVTIEALIKPEWNPEISKNFDEIFRKDYDGPHRLLLSFQNDHPKNKNYSFPDFGDGHRLAFGLYLVGHKYQELELILDGKEGRPALEDLKDGNLHHVVASFDSKSGRKAIYIDGKLVCKHDYAPGTRIISGGPGGATIGNNPGTNIEPFTGTIDELAFYNFALTPGEIKKHYEFTQKGMNYFGFPVDSSISPNEQKRTITVEAGQTIHIDSETGLIK